jgi:hypothetical protein
MNPLLIPNPELEQKIQAKVQQQQMEDAAGAQAATVPFPGPLREVYAGKQDIPVGKWTVRMFWDADFEILERLQHPMAAFLTAAISGKPTDLEGYTGRGPSAWQLNWIMTRPIAEVDKVLVEGGPALLNTKARAEFGELQLAQLSEFVGPILEQLTRYWGPAPSPERVEGEHSPNPPRPSGAILTVSDGGSTK